MNLSRIDSVICYWSYARKDGRKKNEAAWVLRKCYPIDEDGRAMIDLPELPKGSWQRWLESCDDIDDDPVRIFGRAVTSWDFLVGVSLLGVTLPSGVVGLAPTFEEEIIPNKKWVRILEDGHELFFGTVKAARSFIQPEGIAE